MTKQRYLDLLSVWVRENEVYTEDAKTFLRGAISGISFTAMADPSLSTEDKEEIDATAKSMLEKLY